MIILTMFAVLLLLLTHLFGIDLPDREAEELTIGFLIISLILAPIIETFIFQKLPIDYLKKYIERDWLLVVISSIIFAAAHYINEFYISDVIIIFITGWVLAYAYVLSKKRDDMNGYWTVVIIHAGYNLFVEIVHLLVH